MPTVSVDEPTRSSSGVSPEHEAGMAECATPPPAPARSWEIWVIRILRVIVLTGILLFLWRGVAHTEEVPGDGAPAGDPASLDEWIATLPDADSEPAPAITDDDKNAGSGVAIEVATPASHPAAPQEPTPTPDLPGSGAREVREAAREPDLRTPARIGEIPDDAIPWTSTLDLVVAFEAELAGSTPPADPRVLRATLVHHLIDLSVRVGHTDNPKANLEAIRGFFADTLQLVATRVDDAPLGRLRPAVVLAEKRGVPTTLALLALVFADRLSPYLNLEPVRAGDVIALRYRSGQHRYILAPSHLDKLYTERELAEVAFGSATGGEEIESLTRRQFWGLLFGETGSALAREGDHDRALGFVTRGLALYAGQASARITLARHCIEACDLAGAREHLDIALVLDPSSVRARLERAKVLEALGDRTRLEADLAWLSERAEIPAASLALARLFLASGRHRDSLAALDALEARGAVPVPILEEAAEVRRHALASPWIAVLADTERPDCERFAAVEHLRVLPVRPAAEALAAVLSDSNLRLARFAWQSLRDQTGWDIPCTASDWQRALAESPSPGHVHP